MPKIKSNITLVLALILILGAAFRFYNLNWDSGHMLHPDERAIIMTVDKLLFPNSVTDFLSPQSSWNPNFFAYGSFPMYLLRATGNALSTVDSSFGTYTKLTLIGRFISALADLFSIFLIYKIGRKLFNVKVGLLASFFYTISVLSIQLSHFFAVDTLLTSFILATLYFLILFYEKPGVKTAFLVGLFFGLSLATKVSALVLVVSIGMALSIDFLLVFLKKPHRPKTYLPHLPAFLKHLIKYALIICLTTIITFLFFEPYALIDFKNFWIQTLSQSELTKNPFYFPYTLQFVGKIPYVYEFKNIFLWGLGPVRATFSFMGIIYFVYLLFQKESTTQVEKLLIVLIFFFAYVLTVGSFAVGFMRYMLPVYPLFALFAAVIVDKIINNVKSRNLRIVTYFILLFPCLIWPLSFMHIYTKPNPRIQASEWIYTNIPTDKTLAIEHWDDQIPSGKPIAYNMQTLKLYDPETQEKWNEITAQLAKTDYIIIASNRLYAPLQRLTDCQKLPHGRCYEQTAEYYKNLFAGKLGFQKIAEFSAYPTVPFVSLPINDEHADESFSVFDHPKIMIFKKN